MESNKFQYHEEDVLIRHLLAHFGGLNEIEIERIESFCLFASTCHSQKPSKKWLRDMQKIVHEVGEKKVKAIIQSAFDFFCQRTTLKRVMTAEEIEEYRRYWDHFKDQNPWYVPDSSSELESLMVYKKRYSFWQVGYVDRVVLKGCIWTVLLFHMEEFLPILERMTYIGFRGTTGTVEYATIGGACIYVIGECTHKQSLFHLFAIQKKVKNKNTQKLIMKTLVKICERLGVTMDELEEEMVTTCGVTLDGTFTQKIGDYSVELKIVSNTLLTEIWTNNKEKKIYNAIPSKVKSLYTSELKDFKQKKKDILTTLRVQKERIENMYRHRRTLLISDWQKKYTQHPLIRIISNNLIWYFVDGDREVSGIFHEGELVDVHGKQLHMLSDMTQVTIWHPLYATYEEMTAWKIRLEELRIIQPFKQVYREVYKINIDEGKTYLYSNRSSAHILHQFQFKSLCDAKMWVYKMQSTLWDYEPTPAILQLPSWGMKVLFEVTPIAGHESLSGMSSYISTDKVRFVRMDTLEEVPLKNIPILIFSEVMRDVDMFCSIASVGNDVTWRDNPTYDMFRAYWDEIAFGPLHTIAETRKNALIEIVPKMKLHKLVRVEDNYLIVHGKLRTYKIHIGSGNVLINPDDHVLCILSKQVKDMMIDTLYIPFDDDPMLVTILGKMLMLVNDDGITDEGLMRVIQKG